MFIIVKISILYYWLHLLSIIALINCDLILIHDLIILSTIARSEIGSNRSKVYQSGRNLSSDWSKRCVKPVSHKSSLYENNCNIGTVSMRFSYLSKTYSLGFMFQKNVDNIFREYFYMYQIILINMFTYNKYLPIEQISKIIYNYNPNNQICVKKLLNSKVFQWNNV